jgi:hypothetical protein
MLQAPIFMQKARIYMPPVMDILQLETIDGVRFKPREIGIVACHLNGRAQKKIATFL